MKRIFTEDVCRKSGEVKFPAGLVRDFPKPTWSQIASSIEKPLDEFSAPTESTNAKALLAKRKEKSTPPETAAPKTKRSRQRARLH